MSEFINAYPWLSEVIQRWPNQRGHAFLVHGRSGVGKHLLAQQLAQQQLCQQQSACGQCKTCQLIRAASHPDLVQVQPEKQQIVIEQIRSLNHFAWQTAQFGQGKVAILYPAERMNSAAANALLKTLEEPPPGSVFFLVAHRPHLLPATIRSRCQQLVIKTPPLAITETWLHAQGFNPQDIQFALWLHQGAPLSAQTLLRSPEQLKQHQQFRVQLKQVANNEVTPLQMAQLWQQGDLQTQLKHLYLYLHGLLSQSYHSPAWPHVLADLAKLPIQKGQKSFQFLQQLHRVQQRQDNNTHPNPQLVREHLLQLWHELFV